MHDSTVDTIARALADRYLGLLKARPSRLSDGWHKPLLTGGKTIVRIQCKYSSFVFLDLTSNGYMAILQFGVRGPVTTMSDVARLDLSFPNCFDYLNAAYASLGIIIEE